VGELARAGHNNEFAETMSENSPVFSRFSVSVVTFAAAVALDFVSGVDVSPILFYFAAILVISALAGTRFGIAGAVLAVLAWQFMRMDQSGSFLAILWNTVSRLVMLGIAVALGASAKDSAGEQTDEVDHGL